MKEYLRKNQDGSYVLELSCDQEAQEPHAEHWIEVPDGAEMLVYFCGDSKRFFYKGDDEIFKRNQWIKIIGGWSVSNIKSGYAGEILWQRSETENTSVEQSARKHIHYFKDVSQLDVIDVYDVLKLFEVTDPCLQHIIKKALCAGKRGHKDLLTDLQNIVDTAIRAVELNK